MKGALAMLGLVLACATPGPITIKAIAENPKAYAGDTLSLRVRFYGWGVGEKTFYGTAKTRSDWTVEDETGACHIAGTPPYPLTDPRYRGKEVEIRVVVHPQDTSFWLERVP